MTDIVDLYNARQDAAAIEQLTASVDRKSDLLRWIRRAVDCQIRTQDFHDPPNTDDEHVLVCWVFAKYREQVERLRQALLCPRCGGSGRIGSVSVERVSQSSVDCPDCEAAKIRREQAI